MLELHTIDISVKFHYLVKAVNEMMSNETFINYVIHRYPPTNT